MTELVDSLEELATRGQPRGATAVLAEARAELATPRDRVRSPRLRPAVLGAMVAVAIVIGGSLAASRTDHQRTVVAGGEPTAGVDGTLMWADETGVNAADPNTGQVDHVAACAYCQLVALDRAHVFGVNNGLHLIDTVAGTDRTLGEGESVFPTADRRAVYVLSKNFRTATRWSIDGHRIGGPWDLPAGHDLTIPARRAVAGGILVQTNENSTAHTLAVWNPTTGAMRTIGRNYMVIDTYTAPKTAHSLIAWLPADCLSRCQLALTDTRTYATRYVAGPIGHYGIWGGGAFSPNGKTLAAFVGANPGTTNPAADLATIDIAHHDRLRLINSSRVKIGEPFGFAAWAPSGSWLFFGGLDDPLRLYRTGRSSAQNTAFPATYTLSITE